MGRQTATSSSESAPPRRRDWRATACAAPTWPAPVARATSAVLPTERPMKSTCKSIATWLAIPTPAIAAGPRRPTIISEAMLIASRRRFSTRLGQARERTPWLSGPLRPGAELPVSGGAAAGPGGPSAVRARAGEAMGFYRPREALCASSATMAR